MLGFEKPSEFYRCHSLTPNSMSTSTLQQNLRWRYAVKKFDNQKVVSDSDLETILDAGNLSASSFGLQPYRFVVVRDQAIQNQLVEASWNQNQVAEASHLIVIAILTNVDQKYISDYVAMVESERDLPEGTLDPFRDMMLGFVEKMDAKGIREWATRQAYIALGSLMAECADLKIDSCPMEGFLPDQYDQILNLADHQLHATLVLPIGYRADDDKHQHYKKVRKPLDEMVVRIGKS